MNQLTETLTTITNTIQNSIVNNTNFITSNINNVVENVKKYPIKSTIIIIGAAGVATMLINRLDKK